MTRRTPMQEISDKFFESLKIGTHMALAYVWIGVYGLVAYALIIPRFDMSKTSDFAIATILFLGFWLVAYVLMPQSLKRGMTRR